MFEGLWKKKKNKWIALLMVMVMMFSLLPMNINLAESPAQLEPSATEDIIMEESDSSEVSTGSETPVILEETEGMQNVTEESYDSQTLSDEEKLSDTQTLSDEENLSDGDSLLTASENMLSTGNFNLTELELSASYRDENGIEQSVEMSTTENVTLPDDATISLSFDYIMYDGNSVVVGQEYIYPIPDSIRIDVDETLPLATADGSSIGTVHIDRNNQQLVFVFNENVNNQTNIPFYVRFAGGLSADVEEAQENAQISFDTAQGHFDYNVTIVDSYIEQTPVEPGGLGITKTGSKIYIDGKPYIEWNLSLNLNGRDSLNAVITDALPAGLTYEAVGGYPKITDTRDNNATVVGTEQNGVVTLNISNVTTYYRANVRFLTSYDNTLFQGSEITNATAATVANTASIQENGSSATAEDSGNAVITPSLLSKSGTQSGGVITWTVTINRDQLDVGGATYTDTFGSGYGWNTETGAFASSCVTVNPAGSGVVSGDAGGFSFVVNEANNNDVITLTYETKINDYTESSYKNNATLTEPGVYNLSTDASVNGYNLISKNNVSYNEVTKQLKWTVTVNGEKADTLFDGVDTVTITDIFNPNARQNKMKLVSMKITGAEGASTLADFASCEADANGKLTVPADKLKGTSLTITVVTEIEGVINDNYTPQSWETHEPWADGDYVNVKNEAALEWDNKRITTSASRGFQYRTPQLLTKSGEPSKYNDGSLKQDGMVEWTIVSSAYQSDMTINTITLTDTVPEGMTFVPDSMYICRRYGSGDIAGRSYVIPTYNEQTGELTITFDRNMTGISGYFDDSNNFEIHYQTRVSNRENAGTSVSYTNHAEFEVEYDGYSPVLDDDSATVTGDLGGVLRKEALYQSGNNYVDWEVAINEGRFDMSDVTSPVIRDQLASYLQYVQNSGRLYRVDEAGNRSQVTSGFLVNVINNELVVSLPNIGSDTYIFTFRTTFSVTQAQAASLNFSNEIAFQGTGLSTSVSSNNVRNVSFSSSSAGAYHENELRLMKLDPNGNRLAGAMFQIYDAMGTVIARGTTDANGLVVFKGIKSLADGYTYEIVETTAPDGYILNSEPISLEITGWLTASDGTRYYELSVENEPIGQSTEFSIQKVSDDGSTKLSGAGFSVYDDVAMDENSLVNTKETGANGKVTFNVSYSESHSTTYYVKETTAPEGYRTPDSAIYYEVVIGTDGSVTSVTQQPGSTVISVNNNLFTVTNEPVKGTLKIKKTDKADETILLPGASFTLYLDSQCRDDVATVSTDEYGVATFTDLEIGRTYYYKEVTAPVGYLLDDTVYSIKIFDDTLVEADGFIHQDVILWATVKNEQEKGSIKVVKTDDGSPAKLLKDAEFTLYAASDLTTPFLKPGTDTPYVVVTDDNGEALFENLPFGRYVVKETGVPAGYQISAAGNSVSVTVDSLEPETVPVVNDVIRFSLRIVKTDDTLEANPLSGAYFVVRNSSHVAVESGETGSDGSITFDDLPYDTYTITETRGVPGYVMDSVPQTVDATGITADSTITRIFVNHKENGSIQFKKVDSISDAGLTGAVFTLYNHAGDKVKTATSNAAGIVEFTKLPYGEYTVKETKPPTQYQLNTDVWKVTVSDDTPVQVLVSTADNGTTGTVKDEKIPLGNNYMHFKLLKANGQGNPLEGAQFQLTKNFPNDGETYGTTNTNGAPVSATVYSDENGIVEFLDVYIEYDPEGTTYTLKEVKAPYGYSVSQEVIFENYTKLQMIGNLTTAGIALGTDLPFADTPGAVVPDITTAVDIDRENLVVSDGDTYLINDKLLGKILITKKESGTVNTFLPGAEFTLYRLNVSSNTYEVYVQEGLDNPGTTDENGIAAFTNLPLGQYRVVETKAPDGYILNSANQVDFEITEANYNLTDELSATVFDDLISVSVNKYAIGGSVQLEGAVLGLYKANDTEYVNCLERWTTTNAAHKIGAKNLVAGGEYIIHEISAPAGYTVAPEDVKFKVNANGTVTYTGSAGSVYGSARGTSVTIRDKSNSLWISKVGIDTGDSTETTPLSGASISLIDDETGNVVHTFTSTTQIHEVPSSVLSGPTAGKTYHYYTIHENSAPGGYALAEDIKIAIDAQGNVFRTDVNGNKIDETWTGNTVVMEDEKYVNFYFAKRDKKTGDALAGATFGIYEAAVWEANPKRTNTNFASDYATDKPLKWVSTTTAKNVSLNIGTYYFVELKAPDGYVLEEPIKFKVCDGTSKYLEVLQDSGNSSLSANRLTLTSLDSSIVVKFVKWSEDLQPLTGGKFSIHKSDANKKIGAQIGNSFAATGETIILSNTLFAVNNYYAIVEDEAPDGYEKREPMFFYLDEQGRMKDLDDAYIDDNIIIFIDGEKQFGFKKVDAVTGMALPGVEMSVTSEEDTDFKEITWTTDGSVKYVPMDTFVNNKTYILTEKKTIEGYTYAESKTFKYVSGVNGAEDQIFVDGVPVSTMTIVMEDQPISISIDKLIAGTSANLEGALLLVADENGDPIESWITDGTSHELDTSKIQVSEVPGEHVYTLVEVEAPELYACAQPIEFYVGRDGTVYLTDESAVPDNNIIMYDEYTGIRISKQNINGDELPGAELLITSTEDTAFEPVSWTTTDVPYNLDRSIFTPDVTYTLSETAAPEGYACASSIDFTFDDNGNLYVEGEPVPDETIVMVDEALKLMLGKKDKSTDRYLKGAMFGVYDVQTKDELFTFESTDTVNVLDVDLLRTSSGEEKVFYYVRELAAPRGYELAKDVYFYFESNGDLYVLYDGDETFHLAKDNLITIYDEPIQPSSEEETTTTTSRRTGDTSPIKPMAILFVLSLAGVSSVVFVRRRRKL